MDNTNCGENCAFVKCGFCETDKTCPLYQESWWKEDTSETPKLVRDCFPKRMTIEQNKLFNRYTNSQSVVEDVRNRLDKLEKILNILVMQSQEFLNENQKRIDSDTTKKIE